MSARNPLIVRADICGFSARLSAEEVKFSVSCTITVQCHSIVRINFFSSTAIEEKGEWSCHFIANSGSYSSTLNGTYPMGELPKSS